MQMFLLFIFWQNSCSFNYGFQPHVHLILFPHPMEVRSNNHDPQVRETSTRTNFLPTHQPLIYYQQAVWMITLQMNKEEHAPSTLFPSHQFGFREGHSTIHQVHRIVNEIATSLEGKKYCNTVFLDIFQAFDRIWHPGLLFKLKHALTSNYYLLLQ